MAKEPKVSRTARVQALIVIGLFLFMTLGRASAQVIGQDWPSDPEDVSLVILEPRINLYQVDDGGDMALREDWSATARERVSDALKAFLADSGAAITWDSDAALSPEQGRLTDDFRALHAAVGIAMTVHFDGATGSLPTKRQNPDWNLGEGTKELRRIHGVDYALFLQFSDSHNTGERIAKSIGQQVILGSGIERIAQKRIGFASLVHLETGRVVWFGHQISIIGDLRREKDVRDIIDDTFAGFPAR